MIVKSFFGGGAMMNKTLVLKSLNLLNFATFNNGLIHFDSGFNAIIGETGSGKSLILEALQMILGARADKKLVRREAEFATIEASFSFEHKDIADYFESIGYPSDGNEILIKRIIYKDGLSKSYLNFQSCSLTTLTQVAKRFIDLVGQFENQKLLTETYQLSLLDSYAQIGEDLKDYHEHHKNLSDVKKRITDLHQQSALREQRIDFLKFQKDEFDKLNPSEEDERILLEQKFTYQNREQKQQVLSSLIAVLSDNNDGTDALRLLKMAKNIVDKNQKILKPHYAEDLQEAILKIEEIAFLCSKDLDQDKEELDVDSIIEKLDLYNKIKKKFGPTIEDIIKNRNQIETELVNLVSLESNLESLNLKLDQLHKHCLKLAKEIHTKRVLAAKKLSQELSQLVRSLKMNGATISIEAEMLNELNFSGITSLKFTAETNPGEGYYKIKDIASGGELSRILLAIRQVLSSKDSISVFLFDEIDTGMGGETALCIGKSLKEVSAHSQVIAITHLPQIAVNADKLIIVSKDQSLHNEQKRTISLIKEVTGMERKNEISAMVPLN